MGIFVILLCDYSGGYVRRGCLFLVGLKDEIFDGFWGVLSGFLQVK